MVGAVTRTWVAGELAAPAGSWPWATFAVNLAGAFILGYVVTRLSERLPTSAYKRPFLGTGLCGALTTFSTVQLELLRMVDARRFGLAAAYCLATGAAALVAVWLATALARRVRVVL